ncbi:ABC transporter substrate-binding protein [Rhizobium binxianense]
MTHFSNFMPITRRRFGQLGLASVAAASLGRFSHAQEVALVVAQTSDAQMQAILPSRAGNTPWRESVFEPLAHLDPATFEPVPLLAKEWSLSQDGLTMDITLRNDVTFHTGRKMTAEDVKWTFEVAKAPETASQVGFIARDFEDMLVKDDTHLTLRFKHPTANIFDFFEFTPIVDRETYEKRAEGRQIVGTGPYRFVSWAPGASLRLERYDGYRDPEAAKIASIEFAVINDTTAVVSALRSQRAMVAAAVPSSELVEFDRNPLFSLVEGGGNIYPFGVNVTQKPFDTKEVRQAVQYAVDRKRILDQVFDGRGTATSLFWSPSSPGYSETLAHQYDYDPVKAKQMIAAAGAVGAEVEIIIPTIPANRSIFEIVQNGLTEVGLKPKANVLETADYDKRQIAGDLGQAFALIHGQVGFSTATLMSSLPSLRKGNPSKFWSDEYGALRDAVNAAQGSEAQAKAVEALSAYINDQAFNLALVQTPSVTVVSSSLQGMTTTRFGSLVFRGATLES